MDATLPSPHPGKGRLRRLAARFVRPYRWTIALALGGMLGQSLLLLPIPLLQGRVIDVLASSAGAAGADLGSTVPLVISAAAASLGCLLGRAVLIWRNASLMGRVGLEVVRDLTEALHRKLQTLPVAYFDREQTGRLMSRITSDVGSLLIFLSSASLQLVCDLLLAAGIAITLLVLEWRLALVSFAVLPLYVLCYRRFAVRTRELSRQGRVQVAALYALLSERVSAVRVVRSFNQEAAELAELDSRLDAQRAVSRAGLRGTAWQTSLATLIAGLGAVTTLICGAFLVQGDALTVGALLGFYALLTQLYNPIVRLAHLHAIVSATYVAVERIAEALEEPDTLIDRGAQPLPELRGALTFRNVSFVYQLGGDRVLDGISFSVTPGTKVGILGASGAGKSTLLALAPRLYEVPEDQGAVLLDGHDIRDLPLRQLRRAVALVPQQALLFEGTIRSNLLYARPDAPPALVRRVLEIADLHELIDRLPLGLDTPVGERGVSLSGGQRQRLALARALITEPAVLLLDDCTSALDAETDARIRAALDAFLPGRTCLIVSHKISSVRHADRIIVLERGRIAEQGTHAELLRRGGLYAEAYRLQTRLAAGAA